MSVSTPPLTQASVSMVRTKNLSVFYRDKCALQNITVSIEKNRITALIGPSGCGKTSFLNCLNRMTDLIPQCRVEGQIVFNNRSIFDPLIDTRKLRKDVGMIFQKPNPFPFSIHKNLALPLKEWVTTDRQEIDHRIELTLRQVGLWTEVRDRLHNPALALSGGQQQRLCIARALVLSPHLLLMDEPCSALDPLASGVIEDLIVELKKKLTVVLVTHNLAQAKRIADQVAFLWNESGVGQLIEVGKKNQMMEYPNDQRTKAYVTGLRG